MWHDPKFLFFFTNNKSRNQKKKKKKSRQLAMAADQLGLLTLLVTKVDIWLEHQKYWYVIQNFMGWGALNLGLYGVSTIFGLLITFWAFEHMELRLYGFLDFQAYRVLKYILFSIQ